MKAILARLPLLSWRVSEVLDSPFPFFLGDNRKNVFLSFGVSLFVMFFMVVYRPFQQFEIDHTPVDALIHSSIVFGIMTLNLVGLPRLFPVAFDPVSWNLRKYIYFILLICFSIGLACTLVDKIFICPQHSWYLVLSRVYSQVALTGALPVTVITLLLRNNLLQQNLQAAIRANRELEKISSLKRETSMSVPSLFTIYSDTSETFDLHLPDLLFVEASDNYSTFFWIDQGSTQKRLLRMNLKSVENQLNNTYTLRCHRSYLVNVHAISQITGNTNGYKLHIRNTDFTIPVARPKGKEVMDKISELRNMMELY